MNCLQTGGVRCKYLSLILQQNLSHLGGSGSNFIGLPSVNNCTKCCLQLVGAKFGKFSVVTVQRVIYETELRFLLNIAQLIQLMVQCFEDSVAQLFIGLYILCQNLSSIETVVIYLTSERLLWQGFFSS